MLSNPGLWMALLAAVVLLGALVWWLRRRRDPEAERGPRQHDEIDTVIGWPPQVTRVLTTAERQAWQVLTTALPEHLVFAQVPLARFLSVPRRYSYSEWLKRVGHLSADLLVCDKASQVIAVVTVHSAHESIRALRRHERMSRVLKAAGVRSTVWIEGALPNTDAARLLVQPRPYGPPAAAEADGSGARSGPETIPVGDVLDVQPPPMREPPPSTWFDDIEAPVHARLRQAATPENQKSPRGAE